MPRTEKYFIGPALLSDMRQTITRVAGMPENTGSRATQVVHQDMPRRGGKVFRICTFTGSWSINASKTVTFKGVTATPNTVAVVNLFATINGSTVTSTTLNCAIAKDGTAWYLIASECP